MTSVDVHSFVELMIAFHPFPLFPRRRGLISQPSHLGLWVEMAPRLRGDEVFLGRPLSAQSGPFRLREAITSGYPA